MSDIAIKAEGLGKEYIIGHKTESDLRNAFGQRINQLFRGGQTTKESFWALKDIDFEIKKGEAVGIIGRNGAGKSTLLKILSRITEPTTGRFEINGRVSSLLEVGTGFHMELTGRENIYLNGTILGMKRAEINNKFDEIVAFSGVAKFIDTPVKHYSSGMKVRLAFSVAAHLEPEILIIDEVLAVGDAEFQKKCLGKMDDVSKNEGRTVIFVSHDMGAISQLCSKALILDKSKVILNSDTNTGIAFYNKLGNSNIGHKEEINISQSAQILAFEIKNSKGDITNLIAHNENIYIYIEYRIERKLEGKRLLVSLINNVNRRVFSTETLASNTSNNLRKVRLTIPKNRIAPGNYSFLASIHDPKKGIKSSVYLSGICPIKIYDNGSEFSHFQNQWFFGDVFIDCIWKV